jgi:hypothetical protein
VSSSLFLLSMGLAACGAERRTEAPAPTSTPAPTPAPAPTMDAAEVAKKERVDQRRHCREHGHDTTTCARDPQCFPLLVPLCDRCDGGRYTCGACLDMTEVRGLPRDFCRLRAEGRHLEACRLMFPDRPERCTPHVTPAM